MFKQLKNNFFFLYTLATGIMFIIIVIVILVFYNKMINDYYLEQSINKMISEGHKISTKYKDYTFFELIDRLEFEKEVSLINANTDTRTIIIDKDYNVIIDTSNFYISNIKTNEFVKETMKGNIIKDTGTFNNLFPKRVITVSMPIKSNNGIDGIIIMQSELPKLKDDMKFIYTMTIVSILIVIIVALISIIIFSKQMKKILSKFNKVSQQIANGDFSSRIKLPNKGDFGELAKNMNNMAQELENLEDLRKDFIANISHDFRSPLTSIQGFVKAILDGTIPYERQKKYLKIVLDEAEHLTRLTNDILLLTKVENNVLRIEKINFDIHQLIRKVLIQFEQNIIDKDLQITFLTEQKELIVYADMNQIQRVLHNIIDNAIKFCKPKDEIIIETTKLKDHIEVSIKDTGIGISKENVKYIWNRFHKVDRSRGQDRKGIGLGLTIVREIIKAHNETIQVFSEEGKGTQFVFTLSKEHK